MPITKVDGWETSDGMQFTNRKDAERREAVYQIELVLKDVWFGGIDLATIAEQIYKERHKFLNLLEAASIIQEGR